MYIIEAFGRILISSLFLIEGDRKFYISEVDNLTIMIDEVIVSLIAKLRLDGKIDLKNHIPQIATSTDRNSTFEISRALNVSQPRL